VRFLLFAAALNLGVLNVGCDSSTYPDHVRYPERTDLLVQSAEAIDIRKPLPPPGQLDESIADAATPAKGAATPPFKSVAPREVSAENRRELQQSLREIFGTPASPSVEPTLARNASDAARDAYTENKQLYDRALAKGMEDYSTSPADLDGLSLEPQTLRKGSELYRRHCLHCHGVAGDGRGPTGPWVHPHPRDYRQGLFKFISTDLKLRPRKPRRDDLYRTVSKGIDGTSMPAFGLMPQKELDLLVSYVIHLSIRGEVEYQALWDAKNRETAITDAGGMKGYAYQKTGEILAQWAASTAKPSTAAPAYPYDDNDTAAIQKSISRGHALFLGKGICITCHFDYGRQSAYRYDEWGTLVRPRNLTDGIYRGGRRPIDIYWRIVGGIDPSKMPQANREEKVGLSDQDVWDLVNFVQHLPYPAMLPEDVREKIYSPTEGKKPSVARMDHP
jgi:mono/diheme cytochrome c family protein